MLIVEYAKYGNLRDYLRRKRPPGHALSGSCEHDDDDNHHSYKQDDNDDLIRSLTTIDLIIFCLQTASGMEYLHSKKVRGETVLDGLDTSAWVTIYSSASIGIWPLAMFCWQRIGSVR